MWCRSERNEAGAGGVCLIYNLSGPEFYFPR